MWYKTIHSPDVVDDVLKRGNKTIRVVNNGWTRYPSSEFSPANLSTIFESGNYVISFWYNGPDINVDYTRINFTVVQNTEENLIYQIAKFGIETYYRTYTIDDKQLVTDWTYYEPNGTFYPNVKSPGIPVSNKTLWLDQSTIEYSKGTGRVTKLLSDFNLYYDENYIDITSAYILKKSIYDPENKNTDMFGYTDHLVANIQREYSLDFVTQHIVDEINHVTAEEKLRWNSGALQSEYTAAYDPLNALVDSSTQSVLSDYMDEIDTLIENIYLTKSEIINHSQNYKIHPDTEKQAEFDSKADSDHTHILDNRVFISPDDISDAIPKKLMTSEVVNRPYKVATYENLLNLPKTPYHNGDSIYDEEDDMWFFVFDEDKLGTAEAASAFKAIAYNTALWTNFRSIMNRPTTLVGYGITNGTSTSVLDELKETKDITKYSFYNFNGDSKILDVLSHVKLYNRIFSNLKLINAINNNQASKKFTVMEVHTGQTPVSVYPWVLEDGSYLVDENGAIIMFDEVNS